MATIPVSGSVGRYYYNWPFTCPGCRRAVAANEVQLNIFESHEVVFAACPVCEMQSTWIAETERSQGFGWSMGDQSREDQMARWRLVYPVRLAEARDFPNCPLEIVTDYREAKATLSISPRAAAALARRALQATLHTKGVKGRSLASEIAAVLNTSDADLILPSYIAETIDLVRAYGNFAAHPIKDLETDKVVPIENGEAEHCILALEELIDFYFERPRLAKERRDAVDAKLASAGKPPTK